MLVMAKDVLFSWWVTSLAWELGLCRTSGTWYLWARGIRSTIAPLDTKCITMAQEMAQIKCYLVKPREWIDSSARLLQKIIALVVEEMIGRRI